MTIKNQETTLGIVLKSNNYKDNDSIVHVYTKDYGKMSILARGVKKINSKNSPGCQSISLSEFTFIPRSGLSPLIKANLIDYYRYIKEDIELEVYASYFCEFIYKFTSDNTPDLIHFNTLKKALDCLKDGYNPKLVYLMFNSYILKVSGVNLVVDGCTHCGNSGVVGISVSSGGFVCHECASNYDFIESSDVLKGFRYINKYPLDDIDKIKLDEDTIERLVTISEVFVDEYSGLHFGSLKFIKQLNNG